MSYQTPPLVADGAVANVAGAATAIILPAPGVGSRYRIVGYQLTINRTSTGIVDATIQDGGAKPYAFAHGLSVAGTTIGESPIPEPGVQLPDNSAVILGSNSSLATGSAQVIIYYFIDAVT